MMQIYQVGFDRRYKDKSFDKNQDFRLCLLCLLRVVKSDGCEWGNTTGGGVCSPDIVFHYLEILTTISRKFIVNVIFY